MLEHLVIVVSNRQGIHLHGRKCMQGLRFLKKADCVQSLYDVVRELPLPRLVAFVGGGYHGYLEPLLLAEKTALCIIPGAWVRHIPSIHDTQRARFALQLLEAYVNEPIQWMHSEQDLPL